jgi:tetratricopeptide (TPR) repeat protein
MSSSLLALALALAPAGLSPAEQAKERALDAWEAGRYDEARAEIAKAYQLDPLRRYLYARARIEQADGDCATANEFYRRYLAEDPPEVDANAAKRDIAACERQLAEAATRRTIDDNAASTPERPWQKDPLAIGLVTSGAAVLVVGTGLFGRAFVEHKSAQRSRDHAEFDRRVRRARVLSPIGIAGISLGAALVLGGVVRWVIVRRRAKAADRLVFGPAGIGMHF